ncbi:MAG: UDP-GlcNAc--UDP-phosphate GlcNAc-1-phosphate transferase [Bacteroidetes bacterium]|nr:UDP-GlcNAc--UDP-phosphate GlcNAc-1-phosphate transferase [Bacteroidota bacterium]
MTYFLIFILLLLLILGYFKLADKFNIIDKPNERSSHSSITIRGGGIVFTLAVIAWYALFGMQYSWFVGGLVLIAGISFLDDRFDLSRRLRILMHVISVSLILLQLNIFSFHWHYWILAYVLVIGWINAFNFMDGINGITVFYSTSILASYYLINLDIQFIDPDLIRVLLVGNLVFALFNVRKKAKTFAGDVGSVGMAYILAFMMLLLMIQTRSWEYILFFSVYGADSILTIIQRLIRGENIFKAHRLHVYQVLANELAWPHVLVAVIYGIAQVTINLILIYSVNKLQISLIILMSLLVLFTTLKLVLPKLVLNKSDNK